jgi:RNA polymerase sigma-70 factor, ECF subfamily
MEEQLSIRIKMGDEQAFELLFHKYYYLLCCFSNKFLNNHEESKELVQDLFLKIWANRQDINPDESLKSYLYKITQNNCINKLKRNKIQSKYIDILRLIYVENREFTPYDILLTKEISNTIINSIEKLPPKCKQIFKLSRFDGLKYYEISEKLEISVKTVEGQMSKALEHLRYELKEYITK